MQSAACRLRGTLLHPRRPAEQRERRHDEHEQQVLQHVSAEQVPVREAADGGRERRDQDGFLIGDATDEVTSRGIWRHYRALMEAGYRDAKRVMATRKRMEQQLAAKVAAERAADERPAVVSASGGKVVAIRPAEPGDRR